MARKISRINRFPGRNNAARESAMFKKENQQAHSFFGGTSLSFFKPLSSFASAQLIQTKCAECEKEDKKVNRKTEEEEKVQKKGMKDKDEEDPIQKKEKGPEEEEKVQKKEAGPDDKEEMTLTPTFTEQGVVEQNTRHYANCEGVTVQGQTDANYGNSFTAPGTSAPGKGCADCSGEDCVTNTGTVISVFTASPQVTLPDVPDGLNECEQQAVQNFINGKLMAHENQHVAAFNAYAGTVKTPYVYKGCAGGLDAYTQKIHDKIEAARKKKSDATSAALDANGANIFKVTCKCPDPEPES
jgi:hypothetical protein